MPPTSMARPAIVATLTRPPTRSRASRTTTFLLWRLSILAALSPAKPAPTTTTSALEEKTWWGASAECNGSAATRAVAPAPSSLSASRRLRFDCSLDLSSLMASPSGSAAGSRRQLHLLRALPAANFRSGRGFSLSRLRSHLLLHHLLHFFHRRLRLVRTYHPRVSVRIDDGAAPIAPKHVHDRALAFGSEADGFGDNFVRVFHVDKQTRWRGADALGRAFAYRGVFRSQHQRRTAQRQLGVHRFAIGTVHNPALGKAKSFLIKARSCRNIGDCENGRYRAKLLLVEWINFLLSHGVPLWCSSLKD